MKLPKLKSIIRLQMGYRSKIAIIIIGSFSSLAFLIFSHRMAQELKKNELMETRLWTRALTIEANPRDINTPQNIQNLIREIIVNDLDKPLIVTNKDLDILNHMNVDDEILVNPELLRKELEDMANENEPILIELSNGNFQYIFHKESSQLKLMRYLPYVQLFTVLMLVGLITISYSSSKNNEQNKIWVGMAKETAHQLGTPSSSLLGWLEYLKYKDMDEKIVNEIGKDISRLLKVVDRFSKIGSTVTLQQKNVVEIIMSTIAYFQVRKPKNVSIELINKDSSAISANVNDALIEWVMENTIKNAIDAVTGSGTIKVSVYETSQKVIIDVIDSGKGINKSNFSKVFKPGYSTKTRGWGLGLSLCKRIVEENHHGKMYVAESKIDVGTIMRIELKKA